MRGKKFPKSHLIFAILCAVYLVAYIVFYVVYAQRHRADRIVLAIVVTGGFLLVFAIVMLVKSIKVCLAFQKYKRVMQYGTDGACTIIDCKQITYNSKRWNAKFAFVLHYNENGRERSYTTGYDFCEEEKEYLKGLKELKCRMLDDTVYVTERIPDKVYENLTACGKVESKFVRVFMRVWYVIAAISAIMLLSGIALTIALSENLYLIIGAASCFGVNLFCGIVYAVCFFAGKY